MRRHLCGTPESHCKGTHVNVGPAGIPGRKMHMSSEDALKCYRRYLVTQGYKQTSNRTLECPSGGPTIVLTKPSRFGMPFRGGKTGDGGSGTTVKSNRVTPMKRGACGGVISR